MNIIYLDIDGVMNSTIFPKGRYTIESDMHSSKLKLLKKIINECNVDGIIITSERRCDKEDMKNKTI